MAASSITLPMNKPRGIAADPDENLFPALIEWRDSRIRNLSYCLATFFNYLSKPRSGFLDVKRIPGAIATAPMITLDMCRYLLGEIFPCSEMIKEGSFTVFKVPRDLEASIKHAITQNIENKTFFGPLKASQQFFVSGASKIVETNLPDLDIEPAVIQMIWTYVSNGVDSLAFGSNTNEEVKEKIAVAEAITLAKRNAMRNYGLNDDLENSAFQAIIYVIVALMDWLEISEVGKLEVETAYKILVPQDLQKPLREVKSTTLTDIIINTFTSMDLVPTEQAVYLISGLLVEVQKYMEKISIDESARRIINRFMAMAGPI